MNIDQTIDEICQIKSGQGREIELVFQQKISWGVRERVMSLSRYLKSYKSVSCHWCVGFTSVYRGLKKPKNDLIDFLEPSGSRTTTHSGTPGPFLVFQ